VKYLIIMVFFKVLQNISGVDMIISMELKLFSISTIFC